MASTVIAPSKSWEEINNESLNDIKKSHKESNIAIDLYGGLNDFKIQKYYKLRHINETQLAHIDELNEEKCVEDMSSFNYPLNVYHIAFDSNKNGGKSKYHRILCDGKKENGEHCYHYFELVFKIRKQKPTVYFPKHKDCSWSARYIDANSCYLVNYPQWKRGDKKTATVDDVNYIKYNITINFKVSIVEHIQSNSDPNISSTNIHENKSEAVEVAANNDEMYPLNGLNTGPLHRFLYNFLYHKQLKEIKRGNSATIHVGYSIIHKKYVVIKCIRNQTITAMINEIDTLKNMHHPNSMLFIDSFILKNSQTNNNGIIAFIIMELADYDMIQYYYSTECKPENLEILAKRIIVDLTPLLVYIYSFCGKIHVDIKPENMFLKNGRVILGDYGSSICKTSTNNHFGSTFPYFPTDQDKETYDSFSMVLSIFAIMDQLNSYGFKYGKSALMAMKQKFEYAEKLQHAVYKANCDTKNGIFRENLSMLIHPDVDERVTIKQFSRSKYFKHLNLLKNNGTINIHHSPSEYTKVSPEQMARNGVHHYL